MTISLRNRTASFLRRCTSGSRSLRPFAARCAIPSAPPGLVVLALPSSFVFFGAHASKFEEHLLGNVGEQGDVLRVFGARKRNVPALRLGHPMGVHDDLLRIRASLRPQIHDAVSLFEEECLLFALDAKLEDAFVPTEAMGPPLRSAEVELVFHHVLDGG